MLYCVLVGIVKDEEDDDEYGQDDEGDEERRDAPVPILHRRSAGVNSVSAASVGGGLLGVGSTSHGYSHHLHHHQQQHTPTHNPSPVIVTASVPSQGGGPPGLSSAQYNAGASTSTPTNNAAGFNNPLFKLQNSSSSPSTVVATPPELLLPMDFIQVLIHQHAKTIVALQVRSLEFYFACKKVSPLKLLNLCSIDWFGLVTLKRVWFLCAGPPEGSIHPVYPNRSTEGLSDEPTAILASHRCSYSPRFKWVV